MAADAGNKEQMERVITACLERLNLVAGQLSRRDSLLHVLPPVYFLSFAAPWQLLKRSPQDQLAWINAGMKLAGEVIGKRSEAARYGKGRNCAPITVEMAQKALDGAKDEIEKTNLVLDRRAAIETMLLKTLFEYCVMMKILEPSNLATMMSFANEITAQVIASGWVTRNVIKIHGS